MVPMNFLSPMKLLFSCNYAVIGDKSWKNIQIISLSVLPRSLFARLALLSIGIDIKRIFIVWWCKNIADFLSVCVISKVTERCRLIFWNIYFLVYIIGNKKKLCFSLWFICFHIWQGKGAFSVLVHEIWSYRWHVITPQNVAMQFASPEIEHLYLVYWNWMQLCIIYLVSEKCVETPVECMISINGQEIRVVHKSIQFKRICIFIQEDIYWQVG